MSSGQRPRTPIHFPRMKYRARKRYQRASDPFDLSVWMTVRVDFEPFHSTLMAEIAKMVEQSPSATTLVRAMSTVNQRQIRRIAARRYERAADLTWRDFLAEWRATEEKIEARRAADEQTGKPWWRFWI